MFTIFQALKDLDYEVRSKLFLESVLDMEFAQNQDKGVLYIGTQLHLYDLFLLLHTMFIVDLNHPSDF